MLSHFSLFKETELHIAILFCAVRRWFWHWVIFGIYTSVSAFIPQMVFEQSVMHRRQDKFDRRREKREEQINQIIQARRQEREAKRKKIFLVRSEQERLKKVSGREGSSQRGWLNRLISSHIIYPQNIYIYIRINKIRHSYYTSFLLYFSQFQFPLYSIFFLFFAWLLLPGKIAWKKH